MFLKKLKLIWLVLKSKPLKNPNMIGGNELFELIIPKVKVWAEERDLLDAKNALRQMDKVDEETGELRTALELSNQYDLGLTFKIVDGIGDSFITLIILCFQLGIQPVQALDYAYNQIKDRTGKTVDGQFVKDGGQ